MYPPHVCGEFYPHISTGAGSFVILSLYDLFVQFRWLTTIERGKKGGRYVYMTLVWAIWSLRSGCIVPNAIPRGDEICREHKC
jgi:hypothetical protein